jgi:hypothetical protein
LSAPGDLSAKRLDQGIDGIALGRGLLEHMDAQPAEFPKQRHNDVFFDWKVSVEGAGRNACRLADALDSCGCRTFDKEDVARSYCDVQAELLGAPFA